MRGISSCVRREL